MTKPQYKPGEKPSQSGQYAVVGPRGGSTGTEVTGVADKPLPPTPKWATSSWTRRSTRSRSGLRPGEHLMFARP